MPAAHFSHSISKSFSTSFSMVEFFSRRLSPCSISGAVTTLLDLSIQTSPFSQGT
ncbi:hypothetical protein M388_02195 [Mesotoga sp. Brook.08.YT.4.2.5.4.]|nr:hypothetical protein M388_02195 [Mesotoga sp. Brook.08.YT.4.2.5.4.]